MSNKLDDLTYIHNLDNSGALQIAAQSYQQLRQSFTPIKLTHDVRNVVYAAMGGSALAARLSQTWPGYKVPFEIVTDYHLPRYVNEHTLVIAASYSGNTEESINAFHEALDKGAQVAVIAGGGALQDLATKHDVPFVLLPHAAQPRFAAFYAFKALLVVLEGAGLTHVSYDERVVHKAADHLQQHIQSWLVDVPTSKNLAKQLALECMGTSPVIYASDLMYAAAYKWKISFNENAKNVAWCNSYPEFCHNEFIGWASHPTEKPYTVIDLRSSYDNKRIGMRFDIVDRLLSGKRPAAHTVQAVGDSLLEQLVWLVALGDFVSLYVGLLNGIDPTPVALVEKLKAELA